jgi:hypothetical protein
MARQQPPRVAKGIAVAKLEMMDTEDADDFDEAKMAKRKRRASDTDDTDNLSESATTKRKRGASTQDPANSKKLQLARNARASNGDLLLDPDAIALLDCVLDEARTPPSAQCLLAHLLLPPNHSTWCLSNAALQKRAGLDALGNDEAEGWSEALDAVENLQLIQVLRYGIPSAQGDPAPQLNGHDLVMQQCGSQSGAGPSTAVTGGGMCVKSEAEGLGYEPCASGNKAGSQAVLGTAASVPTAPATGASASLPAAAMVGGSASLSAATTAVDASASVCAAAATSATATLPYAVTVGASPSVLAAAASTAVHASASTPAFDLRAFTKNVAMPMLVKAELVKVAPDAGTMKSYTNEELVSKLEAYVQRLERDRAEIGAAEQEDVPLFDLEVGVANALLASRDGCGGA